MTCNVSVGNRLHKREYTFPIRSSKRLWALFSLEIENWETQAHDFSGVIRLWYNLIVVKIKQSRSQVPPGAVEWTDHFSSIFSYVSCIIVAASLVWTWDPVHFQSIESHWKCRILSWLSWFEWQGRDERLLPQSRLILLIRSVCWMFQTGLASKLCSKKIWTEKRNILCENPCFEI